MKRAFIAIDISEEARFQVAGQINTLRNQFPRLRVGWERPEKLHVTLKFLGDVSEERLPLVADVVSARVDGHASFETRLDGTGVFPEKGTPRILWIGVAPRAHLERLAKEIENSCAELGFESERRKFSPHLTIARLRDPAASRKLAEVHRNTTLESPAFTVSQVVIYESKLQPSGSIYSKLAAFPLRGR